MSLMSIFPPKGHLIRHNYMVYCKIVEIYTTDREFSSYSLISIGDYGNVKIIILFPKWSYFYTILFAVFRPHEIILNY